MKFQILLFSLALLIFSSCTNDSKKSDTATDKIETPANTNELIQVDAPPALTEEPAQNSEGVWHYTCTKGCVGGSGVAENCGICGSPLAHNQAYHNTTTAPTLNPNANMPPPSLEPAQNANGVWHFTCAKGCAGGAGSAVACSVCGETLAHNQAYHI